MGVHIIPCHYPPGIEEPEKISSSTERVYNSLFEVERVPVVLLLKAKGWARSQVSMEDYT